MVHMQKYKVIPWCMSKKQAYIMVCLKKQYSTCEKLFILVLDLIHLDKIVSYTWKSF